MPAVLPYGKGPPRTDAQKRTARQVSGSPALAELIGLVEDERLAVIRAAETETVMRQPGVHQRPHQFRRRHDSRCTGFQRGLHLIERDPESATAAAIGDGPPTPAGRGQRGDTHSRACGFHAVKSDCTTPGGWKHLLRNDFRI